jgi:arabinogalactan oligomer/maltooligosaccharide transport system substrate-binding protein
MFKKFMPVLAILLIAAFVLSACQPAAEVVPTEAAPVVVATEAPVETLKGTVTIWQAWKEAEIASLNEVIAAFQAANPDVTFDVLYVPHDDLRGKFETAAATGGGPSVLIGSADWGPALFDAELLADVSGMASADFLATISPAALGATQYKDALIGLPHTVKGVLLFRNKSIIPEPAADLDDFIAKATAATAGDVMGADFEYGLFFSAATLSGVGGALMTPAGDPAFNDAKGVEWMESLKKIKDAGIPMENNNDNDVNSFKAGKVGWIIDGNWNITSLAESIGADNLMIDPWPSPLSGYAQTENIYLSANVTGDDLTASWAFMEYFMSPEAQAILAEVGTADAPKAGHIPATLGVEVTDPLLKMAAAGLAGGAAFPVIPEMGAYWDPVNNALLSVINEGTDPAAALQAAFDAVVAKVAEIRGQ